ncbi:hypothetical protein [Streptomyces caeruleatus]|uniref:Uncharacterized protein n=1 Tax=Streptomyces caeruleatus TaxID=661399 RepID=A0A101TJS6_9ACTN|nr:hypothetical protein [Streptomyces caeruleatus]KUN93654.1 hypothetical protein AQJ67_38655 [Streptomyces caeruleatus]
MPGLRSRPSDHGFADWACDWSSPDGDHAFVQLTFTRDNRLEDNGVHRPRGPARLRPRRHERHASGRAHGPGLRGGRKGGPDRPARNGYHGPVPLETPLRILARVTDVTGPDARKVQVTGSTATEADPDTHLVTADGVFVVPDARRVRALFPGPEPAPQTRLRSSAVR